LQRKFPSENTEDDSHKLFGYLLQNFRTFTIKVSNCGIAGKNHSRKYEDN
jgi:hypothetical protein